MPPRDHFEEAIPVPARDRSGHSRLGWEMVVDTGALDADLGCTISEAEVARDVLGTANAKMLKEVLDALHIDQVDLVGNDSGGGICQIFAALNPDRVRTLTLTNCDTQDNWPPEAFKPFVEMVAAGGLSKTLNAMLGDKSIYPFPTALGPAYEHPQDVSDEDNQIYLRPHLRNEQRTHDLERFVGAFDLDQRMDATIGR